MSTDWTEIHARVHRTLRQRQLIQTGERLLVAVSGGQDSLCLVRLLLDLQPKWGWKIAIAHCNHRWRADADTNAAYVRELAELWRVPFNLVTATQPLISEADAREWRYCKLANLAVETGYNVVATGHTASDRAETLLYNLLRGSGADGLQALAWQRSLAPNVTLVRPILHLRRFETEQFCNQANLAIWHDSTNQDQRYARNRIRHSLLPLLQAEFNPNVEQTLAQTAELLQAEVEFLNHSTDLLYNQVAQSTGQPLNAAVPNSQRLYRLPLKAAPLALQRRVMRRFLMQELSMSPNFEQVEKLVALVHAPNRTQTDPFTGGAIALVLDDYITLVYASNSR